MRHDQLDLNQVIDETKDSRETMTDLVVDHNSLWMPKPVANMNNSFLDHKPFLYSNKSQLLNREFIYSKSNAEEILIPYRTSGIVIELSAIFVAKIIFKSKSSILVVNDKRHTLLYDTLISPV